jgi:hypothetical protein
VDGLDGLGDCADGLSGGVDGLALCGACAYAAIDTINTAAALALNTCCVFMDGSSRHRGLQGKGHGEWPSRRCDIDCSPRMQPTGRAETAIPRLILWKELPFQGSLAMYSPVS